MQGLDIVDLQEKYYCQQLVGAKEQRVGGFVSSEVVFHVAVKNIVSYDGPA